MERRMVTSMVTATMMKKDASVAWSGRTVML
jgi:hypothetical protein